MTSNNPEKKEWKSINVQEFASEFDAHEVLVEIIQDGNDYPIKRAPEMPNNHLMYAITWFGLSATTLLMMRKRRTSNKLFKF